jgi:hypothetical protein
VTTLSIRELSEALGVPTGELVRVLMDDLGVVAPGATGAKSLPRDSRRASKSQGWTAIESVGHLDDPPRVLVVDETGIHPR